MVNKKLNAKAHLLETCNTTLDDKEDVKDSINNVAKAMETFANLAVKQALEKAYNNSTLDVISLTQKNKFWKRTSFKTPENEVFINRDSIINTKVNFE